MSLDRPVIPILSFDNSTSVKQVYDIFYKKPIRREKKRQNFSQNRTSYGVSCELFKLVLLTASLLSKIYLKTNITFKINLKKAYTILNIYARLI